MLALIGVCHGYHVNSRQFNGNTFQDHLIVLEVEQINQFGITENKTVTVKVGKKLVEQGVTNIYNQLKTKQISVPVFVGAWASKSGNAGFDYWLSGDGKPLNLQHAKPVAQAS